MKERKLSKDTWADPTRTLSRIIRTESEIAKLFKNYRKAVIAELKPAEQPTFHTQKTVQLTITDLDWLFKRLNILALQHLITPADKILEKAIVESYLHGTKYADIQMKPIGIRLGAPLDVRQREWKKIGILVEKAKWEFKGVSEANNQVIRRIISDGMVNEQNAGQIEKAIMDANSNIGERRAKMIVRTETMRAVNQGAVERYKEGGINRVEFLTVADERTCEECEGLDGQVFDIDNAPDMPRHINCRCILIPTIEEVTQKYESHVHGGECGAGDPGSPGFQPGNTCAKGDGTGRGVPQMTQERWLGDNTKTLHEYTSKLNESGVKDYRDDYYKYGSVTAADIQNIENNYFGTRRSFEVNDELRFGDLHPATKKIVDSLDRIGTTHGRELPAGIELFRGVGVHSGEYLAGLKPGDICEDKAFQSFTYDSSHAYQFSKTWGTSDNDRTFIRAITLGGEKALHNPEETEILFPRGTSWKVISNDLITPEKDNPQGYAPFNYHIVTVIKK